MSKRGIYKDQNYIKKYRENNKEKIATKAREYLKREKS